MERKHLPAANGKNLPTTAPELRLLAVSYEESEEEAPTRMLVDWAFRKRLSIPPDLRLFKLEPTHFIQAQMNAKMLQVLAQLFINELRTKSY